MKNHLQPGNTLTLPAPRDVLTGELVKIGLILGVSNGDALTGEACDLDVVGTFRLPKTAANAFAIGDVVYLNDTLRQVTSTASGNSRLGVAVEVAAANTTTVAVRLNGSF